MGFIGGNTRGAYHGSRLGYRAGMAYKRGRSRTRTVPRKRARFSRTFSRGRSKLRSAPGAISTQHDVSHVYRKRRMPRRRRRAWVRFSRKVKAVGLKASSQHYNVILRNGAFTSVADKQGFVQVHTTMGLNGDADTNDVSRLLDLAVASARILKKDAGKLIVSGWMCETQIVNVGANAGYVDLYYWRCKAKVPAALPSAADVWVNGLGDLDTLFPIGGSPLDIQDYGVTPFQSPNFSRLINIYQKKRVLLNPGGVTQVETRSGKNYYRNWSVDEEYSMDKCTEGILMVTYGVPSAANVVATPMSLRVSTNKTYTWHVDMDATMTGGTTQL